MGRALCYFSFNFDLTVTSNHTWTDLRLTNENPATLTRAANPGLIKYIDAELLAGLIEFICSRNMIFCFCTMQFRGILESGLQAHQSLSPAYQAYVGRTLFIIDRSELLFYSGNKASALSDKFKLAHSNYGAVHLDDTNENAETFLQKNIESIEMDPSKGFSRELESSLDRAITLMQSKFTNYGRPQRFPALNEATYANSSVPGASKIPPDFDFDFIPLSRRLFPIEAFFKEMRAVIHPGSPHSALVRKGAVRGK